MQELRAQIDELDEQIVRKLAERLDLVRRIGEIKRENKMKAVDRIREQEVLSHVSKLAEEIGTDPGIIRRIYEAIIRECTALESQITG